MAATWAHEQVHSTGHSSRLDRKLGGGPGSQAYAREELVAELCTVLVCHRLQIGFNFENHTAYLAGWVELLKEQPRTLLQVLSDARKVADLIAPETVWEEGEAYWPGSTATARRGSQASLRPASGAHQHHPRRSPSRAGCRSAMGASWG